MSGETALGAVVRDMVIVVVVVVVVVVVAGS
jgi:hypothetical protein